MTVASHQTVSPEGPSARPTSVVSDAVQSFLGRLSPHERTFLPIVGALVVIWVVFGLLNRNFLSSDNLVNLTMQSVASGTIAIGIVLVLMIGQIDLSVGAVSGLGAATVSVLVMRAGLPLWLAILCALAVGVVVGLAYGFLSTRLRLPSFAFTLAGMLMVFGLQLRVLGDTGTVNLPLDSWLVRFCQQAFLPPVLSYAIVLVAVAAYGTSEAVMRARRLAADLPAQSSAAIVVRVAALAAVLGVGVWYLNTNRGVAVMFAVFVALVAGTDAALRRTRWGRSVRAIGGNADSARRAGLHVSFVTVSVFVACSTFAVVGGVFSAGRLASAYQGTGGTEVSLIAIAAAVIGGVSLFGGRGSAWSALLGILVLQSISNGLTLMNLGESVIYAVTGAVLLLALVIDALSRRSREAQEIRFSGR